MRHVECRVTIDAAATTGHALIAVDDAGENTIIVSPGANADVGRPEVEDLNILRPDDVLLLQLEIAVDTVADAARAARAAGARVVLNLAPYAEVPADLLEIADPLVVNEHEHALLVGSGPAAPESLLVTLGAAGSRWGAVAVPAVPVADVVDTTGAGDAYCGTLAARLALGDAPESAMRAASAAAAATVGRAGAQPA
jgi:ribokinase